MVGSDMGIDDRAIYDFIRSLNDLKVARYKALGLKPGEGGRFAPNMQGYEDALADVSRLLPLLRQIIPTS